jgi:WD40 repeat protein
MVAALEADQWERWHQGERLPAEAYLGLLPVAVGAEPRLALVYGEFLVREELGEAPSPDEYLRRFPQFAHRLREQFELHRALAAGAGRRVEDGSATSQLRGEGPPVVEPPAAPPEVPGYRISRELGRGGMGIVYQAWQLSLGRWVALKVLRGGHCADAEHLARFQTEAEVVARLRHPNVVQIYEVGEQRGQPFLALEFVEGGNLAQRLNGTPQPVRVAARLLEVLARAVHHAHRQGVVHRDLKPANVLLTSDSTPKITDFGLAKRLDDAAGPTQSGAVLGTPSYMAPEQTTPGRTADGRPADVYALGAILYELLTGRPPFRAPTAVETMLQVISQDPVPPSVLSPKVPRDLETVCLKCLHKEPAKRYATAQALAEDLARFLAGEPTRARPVPAWERAGKWARRRPAVAALAAALLAVTLTAFGLVTWQWLRAEGERRQAEQQRHQAEALAEAERHAKREAVLLSSRLLLERALGLADRGEYGPGMLWLVRALELAPPDAEELQEELRRFLDSWGTRFHMPRATLAHQPNRAVVAVAFSPDGKTVLTASQDRTARLWDAATGQPLGEVMRHTGPVRLATFSPDGKAVATTGLDRTVWLWGAATGRPLGQPLRHTHAVCAVAFSPDGQRILTGGGGPGATARLWDAGTGQPVGKEIRHNGAITVVSLSPDGKRALTGSADKTARLWGAASGEPLSLPLGHDGPVTAAQFSPDGKVVVTASSDRTARLWDAFTGQPLGKVMRHDGPVRAAAFSPDGKVLVTGSVDRSARAWNAATGLPSGKPFRHGRPVVGLAFSPDGQALLTVGIDQVARLWHVATGSPLGQPLRHDGILRAGAFSPDGKTVVTGGADGNARLWDLARDCPPPLRHPGALLALASSPDGKLALTGGADRIARIWDTTTGKPLRELRGHVEGVTAVAFRPDGRVVATGGAEGAAQLWDVAAGRPLGQPLLHRHGVTALLFGPDGGTVLTRCTDHTVRVWEAATGRVISGPLRHEGHPTAVALSPDGQTILTGGLDQKARLWEAATGRPMGAPLRHGEAILTVAFSPEGNIALAGGARMTRRWEVATRRPIGAPLRHAAEGAVSALAFSPDAKTVVTGKADGALQWWDVRAGKSVREPVRHPGYVTRIAYSLDGRAVLAATARQSAFQYRAPIPLSGDAERIKLWAQVKTGMELGPDGAVRSLDAATWDQRRQQFEGMGGADALPSLLRRAEKARPALPRAASAS